MSRLLLLVTTLLAFAWFVYRFNLRTEEVPVSESKAKDTNLKGKTSKPNESHSALDQNNRPRPATVADRANPPDKPLLFGGDMHLTSQIAAKAGLSDQESKLVDQEFVQMWEDLSKLLVNNAQADAARSDEGAGITAFRIRPFAKEAEERVMKFKEVIKQLIGDRGEIITDAMPTLGYFGNFGKREILVKFKETTSGIANESVMTFTSEERDPTTGATLSETSGPYKSFCRRYGSGFKLVENKN